MAESICEGVGVVDASPRGHLLTDKGITLASVITRLKQPVGPARMPPRLLDPKLGVRFNEALDAPIRGGGLSADLVPIWNRYLPCILFPPL
jgi:hypothetical protein